MGIIKKVIQKVNKMANKANLGSVVYDMSDTNARERQVQSDFEYSKRIRQPRAAEWVELDNYYRGKHKVDYFSSVLEAKGKLPFTLPGMTDCFIQVESQIDATIPTFQFRGRDHMTDPQRVKEREDIVKYICYNNRLERLNIENDRMLNKFGNAFWKVSWDADIKGPGFAGDIIIGNPSCVNIFPDPSAEDLNDCEFIIYAYRIHRRKATRKWGDVIDEIYTDANHYDTQFLDDRLRNIDDDTMQVIEYWYKDDEGDIACSICVGFKEVQFIPKFWEKTRESGNQQYPFIKYCKIPLEQSFWDMSEIEAIKNLVDASDMEFMTAMLNDLMMANDVTLVEEGALKEGSTISNMPGAIIEVQQNKLDRIRRLGGVSQNGNLLNMLEAINQKIQDTTGNATSANGVEPTKVTTASGIAQLNEKAEARKNLKKQDRLKGFEELYKLLDLMALEFYDDNRIIMIRGEQDGQEDMPLQVNSDKYIVNNPMMQQSYYPLVDCEVTAGDGITKSKAFTMQVMSDLINMVITPQNIGLVKSFIDILELPNADELKQEIEEGLGLQMQQMQQQQMMQQQPSGPQDNPQNNPQMEQNGGQPSDMIDQIVESLSPEEFKMLESASPEQQMQILQKLMGGAGNGQTETQNNGQNAKTNA